MRKKFTSVKKRIQTLALLLAVCVAGNAQTILTLEKAMEIAQENSPNIRISRMNLESYQQSLIAQRASLKSRFSLNLSPVDYRNNRSFDNRLSQWYTNETFSSGGSIRVDQPILLTDGLISLVNQFTWQNNQSKLEGTTNNNQAFTNSLYLQIEQPLFTYNTRKMDLKQIEYNYENAVISYALQRLNTERQITSQFYALFIAQNRLEISQEELVNVEQSFAIIKDKVTADMATKGELYQAELNLANAQSSVERNLVSLEDAKDELKQTLGMDLSQDIAVSTSINVLSSKIDQEKAIEHGLASRLELRQREIQTKEQEFRLTTIKAQNEFNGSLALSLGLTGDDKDIAKLYNNTTQNPRVAVSFSVPIFDWGANKARVRAQQINMSINEENTQQQRITIEMDIRQTCRNLKNLETQIKIAEQSIVNAQLTYDLNLTRYRVGDITGMEISQFQTQLSNQKMTKTQALINYKIELLNLKILSLFDFEKNTEIVPLEDFKENK
jgi:outer membrane protein TolC